MIFKGLMETVSYRLIPWLTGDAHAPDVYITNAFYLNWRHLGRSIRSIVPHIRGRCIDVGAGSAPYEKILAPHTREYIVADRSDTRTAMFARESSTFVEADVCELPFESGSADTVLLTQVLEHVTDPERALGEIYRVLGPEGKLILSVPFIYHAHAEPYDYWRFSEYGIRTLVDKHGFEVLEFHYQGYVGTALMCIWNGFLWQAASRHKMLRNTVLLPFLLIAFSLSNLLGRALDTFRFRAFSPNFLLVCQKRSDG